jgi:hypothetical protein
MKKIYVITGQNIDLLWYYNSNITNINHILKIIIKEDPTKFRILIGNNKDIFDTELQRISEIMSKSDSILITKDKKAIKQILKNINQEVKIFMCSYNKIKILYTNKEKK